MASDREATKALRLYSTKALRAHLIERFQRLIRRSSAEIKVSPSELSEIEFMWYACPFANTRRVVLCMPPAPKKITKKKLI